MSEENVLLKKKKIKEDCYVYVMCAPNTICVVLILQLCVMVVGLSLK